MVPESDLDDVAGEVALLHRMLKLNNRLMAPFNTHLAKRYTISENEFRMLMTLGRWGEKASHELADSTGVSAMSVSRAVAALERKGWIMVEVDAANRRRKRLSLTQTGQTLFEEMAPQSDRVAHFLFSRISSRDKVALDRIVDALIDTLDQVDEEGHLLFIEETRLG